MSDAQVLIHPLVLLSISDYITRGLSCGLCLGENTGRNIELKSTTEILFVDGKVDSEWLLARVEAWDVVGWFEVSPSITPSTTTTHESLESLFEDLVFLNYRTTEFPCFERRGKEWSPLSHAIQGDEVESIAVRTISKITHDQVLVGTINAQIAAVGQFHEKVCLLRDYITAVDGGVLEGDDELIRRIGVIFAKFPMRGNGVLDDELEKVCLDGEVTQHVTQMMKTLVAYKDIMAH